MATGKGTFDAKVERENGASKLDGITGALKMQLLKKSPALPNPAHGASRSYPVH